MLTFNHLLLNSSHFSDKIPKLRFFRSQWTGTCLSIRAMRRNILPLIWRSYCDLDLHEKLPEHLSLTFKIWPNRNLLFHLFLWHFVKDLTVRENICCNKSFCKLMFHNTSLPQFFLFLQMILNSDFFSSVQHQSLFYMIIYNSSEHLNCN